MNFLFLGRPLDLFHSRDAHGSLPVLRLEQRLNDPDVGQAFLAACAQAQYPAGCNLRNKQVPVETDQNLSLAQNCLDQSKAMNSFCAEAMFRSIMPGQERRITVLIARRNCLQRRTLCTCRAAGCGRRKCDSLLKASQNTAFRVCLYPSCHS